MASPDPAERERIIDAASQLLTAGLGIAVTDVLDRAQLSTRAFYRHFDSKDALLLALFRRDTERVHGQLEAAIAAAPNPRAALVAWIEGTLRLIDDPRRRTRALVFGSEEVARARGLAAERQRMHDAQVASLTRILTAGRTDGSFPSAALPGDARAIQAACSKAFEEQTAGAAAVPPLQAAAEIADFALRALGAVDRGREA